MGVLRLLFDFPESHVRVEGPLHRSCIRLLGESGRWISRIVTKMGTGSERLIAPSIARQNQY